MHNELTNEYRLDYDKFVAETKLTLEDHKEKIYINESKLILIRYGKNSIEQFGCSIVDEHGLNYPDNYESIPQSKASEE